MKSVRRLPALLMKFGWIVWALGWIVCSPLAQAGEDSLTTYSVRVATVVQKNVHEWLHVYGRVGFDDAALQNINLAYGGQVIRLPLLAGEPVKKGQTLAEIAVDPAVASAYQQALSAVRYAESDLARMKKMLAGHLATRSQKAVAQKKLATARTRLHQLQQQGFGKSIHVIRADFDAVVASVAVQTGQRIVAGTTLMQLGHPEQLKVILGVEPEDINRVKPGNTVLIQDASQQATLSPDHKVHASLDRILHAVNPQTRLVDVLVRLAGDQAKPFLPGMTVSADIAGRYFPQAVIVPHRALVLRQGQTVVMQIDHGVAHSIPVRVIMEQGSDAVLTGHLAAGQHVVVDGAAELHDGDKVIIAEGTPQQ